MFQNITGSYEEEPEEFVEQKNNKSKKVIKQIFTKQNIILYILSFMISSVGFGSIMAPFGIALIGACCSAGIPLGIIYVLSCIGTFIGFGKDVFLLYILTSLIFMGLVLLFKPKFDEHYNRKVGVQVGLACFIVQAGRMFFDSFLVYDLLQSIAFAVLACVFYKIFAGSIHVIRDLGIKKAFAVEEVIGASLMIAIAIAGFRDVAVFGYSIRNILSILLVLLMGWQNGILVGATTGVTIGVVLGIIGNAEPLQVAAYALSGMVAGILNKLGKIGVIIGFVLGNGIIAYVMNGNSHSLIMIQEILIASLGLLAVPKSIQINIEDLFGKTKYLPKPPEKALEQNKEAIYKLNSVSEAISEVAESYEQAAATVVEEEIQEIDKNKHIFIDEFRRNIISLEDNILYDELIEEDNEILDDIFDKLVEQDFIESQDLLDIFANHNNYIMGFDDSDIASKIEQDISSMIKAMNYSYRVSKINFIWKKKIDEKKKTMKSQLDGISKAISSIADEMGENETLEKEETTKEEEIKAILEQKGIFVNSIAIKTEQTGKIMITVCIDPCQAEQMEECKAEKIQTVLTKVLNQNIILQHHVCPLKKKSEICHLTFCSEDNYTIQIGIAKATKKGSPISGDSMLQTKLEDGKYLLAISDGMGSGPNARKSSKIATKMLERLLTSGFNKEVSIDLINSSINLNANDDTYATLDIAILDLYKGNIEFIKNGACPTFIKNRKKVDVIKTMSLPAGILDNIDLTVYDRDIDSHDILVMCSDGIVESNEEYENKELWVKYLLEEIETDNVQKIADILLNESIDNGFGIAKDDMTVIVAKLIKK